MTVLNILEEYLSILEGYNKRDEKTITAYRIDIKEGIKYIFGTNDCTLQQLDSERQMDIIQKWFIPLRNEGIKATTINRKISSFKGFCNFLVKNHLIENNPFEGMKKPKDDEIFEKNVLTDDEVIKLLKVSNDIYEDDKKYSTCRDNLILNILIGTGMRVHEVEKMDIDDVHFATGEFKCIGKRDYKRDIALNKHILKLYREFLSYRNQIEGKNDDKNSSDALFLSRNKTRLTTRQMERIITKLVKAADVKNVTPHSFKHKFITTMNSQGAELSEIGKFTGNKSIQTMYSHYLHQPEQKNIVDFANSNPFYQQL